MPEWPLAVPCCSRPSIDLELMIRMPLVWHVMGIRSERRLCEEVHLNLAYRWFCRLDLTDPVPDHSTFSKNRHWRIRESGLLRHLFETVVVLRPPERLRGVLTEIKKHAEPAGSKDRPPHP